MAGAVALLREYGTLNSASAGLPQRDLSFEQILTTRAGKLSVRVPAVLEYGIFLSTSAVDRIGARPVS